MMPIIPDALFVNGNTNHREKKCGSEDFRLEYLHITYCMILSANCQHQLTQTGTDLLHLGPISRHAQIIFIIGSTVVMCVPTFRQTAALQSRTMTQFS